MKLKKTPLATALLSVLLSTSATAGSWDVTQSATFAETTVATQNNTTSNSLQAVNDVDLTYVNHAATKGEQTINANGNGLGLDFNQNGGSANSQVGNRLRGQVITSSANTVKQEVRLSGGEDGGFLGSMDFDQVGGTDNQQVGNLVDSQYIDGNIEQGYAAFADFKQDTTTGGNLQAGNAIKHTGGGTFVAGADSKQRAGTIGNGFANSMTMEQVNVAATDIQAANYISTDAATLDISGTSGPMQLTQVGATTFAQSNGAGVQAGNLIDFNGSTSIEGRAGGSDQQFNSGSNNPLNNTSFTQTNTNGASQMGNAIRVAASGASGNNIGQSVSVLGGAFQMVQSGATGSYQAGNSLQAN